jgi:hypothetical protein
MISGSNTSNDEKSTAASDVVHLRVRRYAAVGVRCERLVTALLLFGSNHFAHNGVSIDEIVE